MSQIFTVVLGGALGALTRYGLISATSAFISTPGATFAINVLGCFLAGCVAGAYWEEQWFVQYGRTLLLVGFLGGFTTYSAFSLDFLNLLQGGKPLLAFGYAMGTVVVCLLAAMLGTYLVHNDA